MNRPGHPRTPAMIRTNYDRLAPAQLSSDPALAALRPPLAVAPPDRNEEQSAFGDWLAHVAAGRIAVR